METKLSIIQFPHSGNEPPMKGASGICPWNTGDHHRKFMKVKGKTVMKDSLSPETDVYFWGEWEPESRYSRIAGSTTTPLYLHEPYFPPVTPVSGASGCGCGASCSSPVSTHPKGSKTYDNTDPFVFGDYFIYSNCRQLTCHSNVKCQTACLEIGSLILFGSVYPDAEDPYFGLDTVFVVDEKRPYTACNCKKELKGFVPSIFPDVMLFGSKNKAQYTCYHGATYHSPCNGMYSFVPCRTGSEAAKGFMQPVLHNDDFSSLGYTQDVLKSNNRRNFYRSLGSQAITSADVKLVWQQVREIIAKQGYSEGVELRLS